MRIRGKHGSIFTKNYIARDTNMNDYNCNCHRGCSEFNTSD